MTDPNPYRTFTINSPGEKHETRVHDDEKALARKEVLDREDKANIDRFIELNNPDSKAYWGEE